MGWSKNDVRELMKRIILRFFNFLLGISFLGNVFIFVYESGRSGDNAVIIISLITLVVLFKIIKDGGIGGVLNE